MYEMIDKYTKEILECPLMYGGLLAAEMQILLLLDLKYLKIDSINPREILDMYQVFLKKEFGSNIKPLSALELEPKKFSELMKKFVKVVDDSYCSDLL